MVYLLGAGLLCLCTGAYIVARPLSIRTFPPAAEWKAAPEDAEKEQRAYAGMTAFFLIVVGVILVGIGVLNLLS